MIITEKRLVTYKPDLAAKKRYEINKMVEKVKMLTISQAKRDDFGETGKYVNFTDEPGSKAKVIINQQAIKKDLMLARYNLIFTSETPMKDEDIYNTYHNLWWIKESFRIMKSDLDAPSVFVQNESAIKGHFLSARKLHPAGGTWPAVHVVGRRRLCRFFNMLPYRAFRKALSV